MKKLIALTLATIGIGLDRDLDNVLRVAVDAEIGDVHPHRGEGRNEQELGEFVDVGGADDVAGSRHGFPPADAQR